MVDFSEAERNGFVEAFVDFRQKDGTSRTSDDLRAAASKLLKGCRQHFHSGVTRVARIGGVIHPDKERLFRRLTGDLLTASDQEEFHVITHELLVSFPEIKPWLEWWMRDAHASMLFESRRRMNPVLWESMPNTTNAEESMHWRIYSAVGCDHNLMDGIRAILAFVKHFDAQVDAVKGKF